MPVTSPSEKLLMTGLRSSFRFQIAGSAVLLNLVLGGGTRAGFLGDAILQLLCVPLLYAVLRTWQPSPDGQPVRQHLRLAFVILGAFVVLLVSQLVPLPPDLWTKFPGRQFVVESLEAANLPLGWMPLSVAPDATWFALLSLLPAIVVFLATLGLDLRGRRLLVLGVLMFGAFSALLGLAQVAQGPQSSLRPFEYTNLTEAVGLFANRNHFSALLYACLLFAFAWGSQASQGLTSAVRRREGLTTRAIVFALIFVTLIVLLLSSQAMARSRAGFGLTLVAVLIGLIIPFGVQQDRRVTPSRVTGLAMGVALIFALQFAFYRNLERFDADPFSDARIPFARNTIRAALAFMPFGSGAGTFVPVYGVFERLEDLYATYANRAHNDFLEAWLELGAPGLLVGVGFAIWFTLRARRVWLHPAAGHMPIDVMIARAASMVVLLLVLHSAVDYPLRTAAISAVFAMCCGLMMGPPQPARDTSGAAAETSVARSPARRPMPAPEPALGSAGTPDVPNLAPSSTVEPQPPPPKPATINRWREDGAWPAAWQTAPEQKKPGPPPPLPTWPEKKPTDPKKD